MDFVLAPANLTDLTVGADLLQGHTALTVLGDKGYHSAPIACALADTNGIQLLTPPKGTTTPPL